MFPIVNIDYEKVLEETRKKKYKCVIFFLYTEYSDFYNSYLSEKFEEINGNSGKKVAFITHYVNDDQYYKGPDYLKEFRDWGNLDRNPGRTKQARLEEDRLAYKTMREVAKAFECGMENRLPCFVIFDPQKPQFFVEKSAKRSDDIFVETQLIILNLQAVNYDIRKYALKYKEPHYYLSATEILDRNIRAANRGIEVAALLEVINSSNLEDSFNSKEIERLQKQGYIPIKKFYRNLDRLRIGDIPEGPLSKIIDKYLAYYSSQKDLMFPGIADFVESSSRDYLRVANDFNEGMIDAENIKASMVAICLGKVVEDEMNLGIFNLLRGSFSVSLPEYYDKYQEGLSDLRVMFRYMDANDNPQKLRICFNERENNQSCKLQYPKVSFIRRVAFDNNCVSDAEERKALLEDARRDIKGLINKIAKSEWTDIYSKLEIIAETRNHAIHHAKPIKGREARKTIEAFQYLVDCHFFEVNSELKKISN